MAEQGVGEQPAAEYLEVVFNLPVHRRFAYTVPAGVHAVPGVRVAAPLGRRRLLGCAVGWTTEVPDGVAELKAIERAVDSRPIFGERTLDLARWVADMYLCSLGEALSAMLPGGHREREPEELGGDLALAREFQLSEHQERAIDTIAAADQGLFYLYGVTGSGKTEVFLNAAKRALEKGRGVIYLVPEISLTHQAFDIFSSFLDAPLAVLHSGLTPSQRLKEWLRVLDGEARVVIGARSGVFAPVADLGLVIIDEEHEGSYKSGTTPRYSARQVAMHRCRAEGAVLVMGSATPSLEAVHAMRTGQLHRLVLPERLSGGKMPEVSVQSLVGESVPLSRPLIREILRTKAEGRQTILFLNRRGFAYFFHCRSCGYEMKCRHCSVSLTFHKQRNLMVCHYCGYRVPPVQVCPQCGSVDVGYSGFGTERIEEEVQKLFPEMTVRRVDTDAVRKRETLRQVLDEFRRGEIDILLGTQMVAKGLNFPGVRLVGIVSADTGLMLPDFRAPERTFDLIVQVSGRAGRFHPDGKVVVQTYRPEDPTIRLGASADLEGFHARELEARRQLGFPPYTRMIRFVFRSRDFRKARGAARAFAAALPEERLEQAGTEMLGPAECPLSVISGNHRQQVILRSEHFRPLHALARQTLESFSAPSSVHVEVDVDPVSLL
ncbi:MAG: primosomal protein N' [Spirochaetales bacterium]|nr:primosomal protein N' [Spirochaetales bacterium]